MIVSSIRMVGRVAGRVVDEEDRRVLGGFVVVVTGVSLAVISLAVALGLAAGLAVRAFEFAGTL